MEITTHYEDTRADETTIQCITETIMKNKQDPGLHARPYARGLRNAALFVAAPVLRAPPPDEAEVPLIPPLIPPEPAAVLALGDLARGEKPELAAFIVAIEAGELAVPIPALLLPATAAFEDTILEAAAEEAIEDIIVADKGLVIPAPPPLNPPEDPGDAGTCADVAPGPAMTLLRTNLSPYACSYSLTDTSIDLFSSASSLSRADLLLRTSVRSEAVAEAVARLCSLCSISCFRVDI